MRDREYRDGAEVWFRQWPDTPDGLIDDDGSVRAMTADEVAEWHARNPPPPLVDPADRLDDDRLNASIALITQDMLTMRGTLEFFAGRGRMPTAPEAAAITVAATKRLTELAEDDVFRAMAAPRIAAAEQHRT